MFSSQRSKFMIIVSFMAVLISATHDYDKHFDIVWGNQNARIHNNGRLIELSLDEEIGSRIQLRDSYMHGRFDFEIKLVKGEPAGTVSSFYICTGGTCHDVVDFEFLGNGFSGKEHQFSLLFDPTEDFHTYSILWNPLNIMLFVDGTPIKVLKNNMEYGIVNPTSKPIRIFASIWDAEDWATRGGQVIKTNWSKAPFMAYASGGNFYQNVDITWGDGRGKILNNGELLTLSMDKSCGSGFQSKNKFLFGQFDVQMKLIPNNSAGTVATFYLSSQGSAHDEIDLEFLGNLSGDPYTLHTNIFAQGIGNRVMQFNLWFDPTTDFHNYSVLWNPTHIVFYVDGTAIREYTKKESAFPNKQQMRVYSSLWDGEDWATRGGMIKTDWTQAPFTASYGNFNPNGCTSDVETCSKSRDAWMYQDLNSTARAKMHSVQKIYRISNYCIEVGRFREGLPPECTST